MRKSKNQLLAEKYGLTFWIDGGSQMYRVHATTGELIVGDASDRECSLWQALVKADGDILTAFRGGQVDV